MYCFDTMTLIGPGTWEAARGAADAALTAADLVAAGEAPAAYACTRPPGHHVTRTAYGGSCYLNNAALAAARLREALGGPVALLDVDAHHGNGAQSIFAERTDVLTGSVHVDPAAGWFPHFLGHAGETCGGTNRNLPLAPGSGDREWLAAVQELARWARGTAPAGLVVALGVDAAGGDPESPLEVTEDGYRAGGPGARRARAPDRDRAGGRLRPGDHRRAGARHAWPDSRRQGMDDALWVGRDEVGGHPRRVAQGRRAAAALAARGGRGDGAAALARPRARTGAAPSSSRTARPPTSGCSTSPIPSPQRVTTGRDPMPYWEDTAPQLSPDGTRVAYAEEGAVKLAPTDGGPPVTAARRGRLAALDRRRDAASSPSSATEDASSRLAVTDAADGWPRRLADAPRRPRRRVGRGRLARRHARSPTSSRRATTSSAPRSASPTSRRAPCAR